MRIIIRRRAVQALAGVEPCLERGVLLPQSSSCLQSEFVELEFPVEQGLCQYYS